MSRFSADSSQLVVANEDDREDRPCKPADRNGGSVSVLSWAQSEKKLASVVNIPIDHAMDSEPENVAVTPDGVVVVPIQETSEVAIFSLADLPEPEISLVKLTTECGPDGLAIHPEGKLAFVGCERTDAIAVLDVSARKVVSEHVIFNSGDVPGTFNIDQSGDDSHHEPSEMAILWGADGWHYLLVSLQESHAAISYRIDGNELVFDSISPVGKDYTSETSGRAKSGIGCEGITADSCLGLVLTANEREGSFSLVQAGSGNSHACPK